MSGPKAAKFILTAAQKRVLDREDKEQQEKRFQLITLREPCKTEMNKLRSMSMKAGNNSQLQNSINRLIRKLKQLQTDIDIPIANISLKEVQKHVSNKSIELGRLREEIQALKKVVDSTVYTNIPQIQVGDYQRVYQVDRQQLQREYTAHNISNAVTEELRVQREKTIALKASMLKQLEEMQSNENISDKLGTNIRESINRLKQTTNSDYIANMKNLTMRSLLNQYDLELQQHNKLEELKRLFMTYEAAALEVNEQPELDIKTISREDLEAEIQRLEEKKHKSHERIYIQQCLDKVMEEMGYPVIGSYNSQKNNGTTIESKLFNYEDGTAVNITCSSTGSITMELGGLDDVDRLPDDDEAEDLCGHMERFCKDYTEIERRLARYGIVASERISMLPPDIEYAQIINISDYNISKEAADKFEMASNRRNTKQDKAYMKQEGN